MSTQKFLNDAIRVLLLLLHANEGKKEMLKLNLYEFEMIKKMCREGSPAGDERIRTLIAAGDAATDMTTFAKVHKELVEKFEQHVPDMKFIGQDHLDGFFTEMTFDKDGTPRKSERRVLSNIAPDAQAHIGYAVMLYIFQRQAELSKTAMTSMGATKTAQAIFKKKKKSNGGARVKFLNYATFFAYYGLVELIRENENGKPIIMLHLTDEGIAWWSRICMRTRELFAKHEARIAQLEADLAALTQPGPKAPVPSKPLFGIAIAAFLALAASGSSAQAEEKAASVTYWTSETSLMPKEINPAYVVHNAHAVEDPRPIAVNGIPNALYWSASADLSALAAGAVTIKTGASGPETDTNLYDVFKQSPGVVSIAVSDLMNQSPVSASGSKADTIGTDDWMSIQIPGKGARLADPTSTTAGGLFNVSSDRLGRPIGRLGETEPLDLASLEGVIISFAKMGTDMKIDDGAHYQPDDLLAGTYQLDVEVHDPVAGSLSTSNGSGNVFGMDPNPIEMSNWAAAFASTSSGVPAGSMHDSWVQYEVLANSLGRPIDRLGETEPLIMVNFTDGDT